jgi:regulatory protein
MRALARREHSAQELKRRLEAAGAEPAVAGTVVAEFAQAGWQSDERFAELLVSTRIEHGFGPLRIEAEMQAAGIEETLAARMLTQAACDWRELAREVHGKRFAGSPANARDWQRQYRFLAQRGFSAEDIHAVLKEPIE